MLTQHDEDSIRLRKKLKGFTAIDGPQVYRENFVCAKSYYKYRQLNRTDNPQLNAFEYSNSFTFFDDIQKQRPLETKQPPFRITKPNTFHYCAFA